MSLAARVGRAIFWGQAGRFAEAAILFFFSLLLARVLGPASYGLYALGMSLAGVCGFLTLLGLGPETLGRFLPEIAADGQRHRANSLLRALLAIRFAAIVFVACLVFIFRGAILARLHFPLVVASLAAVLLVFTARSILDLLTYFSSGLLELRRVALAKLAAAAIAPILFLMFLGLHRTGVNSAWLAFAGGSFAGIAILAFPFFFTRARGVALEPVPVRRILAFGMFTWATNFFLYVLGDNMDVLLLGWLVPDRAAIGCYAVGAKIVFSVTALLLGWVSLVSVASFSESYQRAGIAGLARVVEAQWKLGVLCLIAPLLLIARYAREIVTIFYSPAYVPGVRVVEILCSLMACGVVCGFSIQGGILYALDHERIACAAVALAALFNLASEIFLVQRLGIAGAAWATGLSFVLVAILCTAAGIFYVPFHFPAQFIGRVTAAAAFGVASTLWLHPASAAALGAACALCGSVFFACLALFKPLTSGDSAELHRVNGWLGAWAERLFAG
jgi:O-antigen/teichoic acid export membrane protein